MIHDNFILNLEQAATFFNVVGAVIPMVISLAIVMFYREAYFRYWTLSYAFFAPALFLDLFSDQLGHPPLYSAMLAFAHVAGNLFLFKAGFSLRGKAPALAWQIGVAACIFGWAAVQLAVGIPMEKALLPSLAANLVGHAWLGWTLWQMKTESKVRPWLAFLSLVTGAWGLTYPVLLASHVVWLGYMVIGTLHLFVGVGMALFLFESNAHLLAVQNAELTRLDLLKNNFISTISHEFRTPLSAIRSATWFSMRADAEQLKEINQIIGENVDRLTSLVNDVLDYSRMEAGVFTYEHKPVDLVPVAESALLRLQGAIQEKRLHATIETSEPHLMVEGDADRLGQVIENLLSNACKFTPSDGRVTISLAAEGAGVVMRVSDTGIGISPDEHGRIFTKFFQVDSNSKRKAGGTGLGLAIARSIVEDGHHGRLEVESQLGEGSTFTVRLPGTQESAAHAVPSERVRSTGRLG